MVNLAVGGHTTYSGLATQSQPVPGRPAPDPAGNVDAAIARDAKLVLVSFPTNDTAAGYGVDETVRNLLAIRDAARAQGVAVMILSTQPRALTASQLAMLPQIDARVSAAVGPCFVAVREVLAGPDAKLDPRYDSGDGVHPNDAGHALIEAQVRAVVDGGHCVSAFAP
jgi:lysophospholipase L1-like esterase